MKGVQNRCLGAVRLHLRDSVTLSWHNKALKSKLKGNIWTEETQVSYRGKREREGGGGRVCGRKSERERERERKRNRVRERVRDRDNERENEKEREK